MSECELRDQIQAAADAVVRSALADWMARQPEAAEAEDVAELVFSTLPLDEAVVALLRLTNGSPLPAPVAWAELRAAIEGRAKALRTAGTMHSALSYFAEARGLERVMGWLTDGIPADPCHDVPRIFSGGLSFKSIDPYRASRPEPDETAP